MYPFNDGDTHPTFQTFLNKIISEIDGLDNDYVLKASPTELEEHYIEKAQIDTLVLHSDQHYIENQTGTKLDVSHDFNRAVFPGERAIVQGTRIDIAIPFEGDSGLFRLRPSSYSLSGYPDIDIRENVVIFSHTFPDDSPNAEQLKREIKRNVDSLAGAVRNLQRDVDNHNSLAPQSIKSALERKRKKAEASVNAIADLGIPIKRKDHPPTFAVPAQRRRTTTQRPKVPTEKYQSEPTLDLKEYEHILDVCRSMALVIERSPGSFVTLDEEAIRTHFLLQLNGHYEGNATGETFNASGKTDILIRIENRNIFIAECKFWRGPKDFNNAIDQLLGYLTWRDSKCALLIFNQTRDSSAVRAKMHEMMESRPEHRKTVNHDPEGDSRYIFIKNDDPGKEILITTQLFDLPKVQQD